VNGWQGRGDQDEDFKAALARLKVPFAIGGVLGLLVLCWMRFARADEERVVSSSGFSESGAGLASSPFAPSRAPAPAPKTGLSLVSRSDAPPPSSVRLDSAPGGDRYAASSPGSPSGAAANPAPAQAAAEAAPAADPKEMAAAGLPTDAAGLKRFGSDNRMMTDAIARLLDHPRLLKALFDNKLVVSALMDRETSQRNCSDGAALQSALSSPGAGQAMNAFSGLISNVLSRPDTVAALAGSEMGSRLMACPSIHALASSPAGLASVVMSNPQAMTLASDPRVAQALTTLPQGPALLGDVQSAWSSAAAAR
jgi:hypothetical protein